MKTTLERTYLAALIACLLLGAAGEPRALALFLVLLFALPAGLLVLAVLASAAGQGR